MRTGLTFFQVLGFYGTPFLEAFTKLIAGNLRAGHYKEVKQSYRFLRKQRQTMTVSPNLPVFPNIGLWE